MYISTIKNILAARILIENHWPDSLRSLLKWRHSLVLAFVKKAKRKIHPTKSTSQKVVDLYTDTCNDILVYI